MTQEEQRKAYEQFEKAKSQSSPDDEKRVFEQIDGMNKGKLAEIWDKVMLLFAMLKDPNAPLAPKAIALGALVYAISPIDAIPDIIPFLGLSDDVGIVALAVQQLGSALERYKK